MNPEQNQNPNGEAFTSAPEEQVVPDSAQQSAENIGTSRSDDMGNHKVLAIVGYILPFLFFLPLLSEEGKKNEFAMFHANQHLILLIALVILYFIHSALFMMFFMGGYFLSSIINLAFLVLVIVGIVNAAQGKMKELPLIGGFNILNK